ncbi:MAG TPA: hypothetical protein VI522_08120 [Gammaproteobacteria bacterium]|nr:hypothetical protein [Gammaproteobacteria bacterium]
MPVKKNIAALLKGSATLFTVSHAYQASDLLLEGIRAEVKNQPVGKILNDPRANKFGYPIIFKTTLTCAYLGLDAYISWWRGYIPYSLFLLTTDALSGLTKKADPNSLPLFLLKESLPLIIWVAGLSLTATSTVSTALISYLLLRLLFWPEQLLPLTVIVSSQLFLSGARSLFSTLIIYGVLQAPPLILQQLVKKLLPLALFVSGMQQLATLSFIPAVSIYFLMRNHLWPLGDMEAFMIDAMLSTLDSNTLVATTAYCLFQAAMLVETTARKIFHSKDVSPLNHIIHKQMLYLLMPWVLSGMLNPVMDFFGTPAPSEMTPPCPSSATKSLQLTAGPVDWSKEQVVPEHCGEQPSYFSFLKKWKA